MKRTICRFIYPITVIIMAALFCMTIILASPLMAKTSAKKSEEQISTTENTGAKINELHTRLKITPAQEDQWKKVADAMRENASTMENLIQARRANMGTMNAVANLKSYQGVSEAHAGALAKFVAAFEPLYDMMSAEQKQIADATFSHVGEHRGHKRTKK